MVRAELTLSEQPSLLYIVMGFDVLLVLLVFVLGGRLTAKPMGVEVALPESQFRLGRYEGASVLTVKSGVRGALLYIGREKVEEGSLEERLKRLRKSSSGSVLVIKVDEGLPVGVERRVVEAALGMGFRCVLLGDPKK